MLQLYDSREREKPPGRALFNAGAETTKSLPRAASLEAFCSSRFLEGNPRAETTPLPALPCLRDRLFLLSPPHGCPPSQAHPRLSGPAAPSRAARTDQRTVVLDHGRHRKQAKIFSRRSHSQVVDISGLYPDSPRLPHSVIGRSATTESGPLATPAARSAYGFVGGTAAAHSAAAGLHSR